MTLNAERWGIDLRLLANLEQQTDRDRAHDLLTTNDFLTEQSALLEPPVDLVTVSLADNLKQALLLRFLTPVGDLAALGHPEYGSRLSELIGELNSETNRNRAKLYVLQALAAEPRVKQVKSVVVRVPPSDRTRIDIDIVLLPIDSDTPLNLVFPFFLDRGIGT